MKTMKLLTVLTFTLTSLNSHAIGPVQIKEPGINKPKLTVSEDQLIQMIKSEHGQAKKTATSGFFEDNEIAQLEELLQARVVQESSFVSLRDQNTLNNVLSFSALALQAWNPELRNANLKTQIVRNIVNFGFMQGLVVPTMALIDLSYATGKPNFGNLLNVMLADITPSVAAGFESKYQIPTLINGQNFASISATGRGGMWQLLITQLGSDFFANHSQKFQDSTVSDRINPMNLQVPSMDHFVDSTLKSENSYLSHYMKMIGHENSDAGFGLNVAAIKQNSEKNFNQRKGVFSNASASESSTCLAKCMDEVAERASKYAALGTPIGSAIGGVGGLVTGGPVGAVAGAKTGGIIGAGVGVVVGAGVGAYECTSSKQCGGDEDSIKKENAKKEKELEQKENQVKAQKEKQDQQREQLQKQQENLKKEQAEVKKQQDEVKRQQDEIKKQQEELKKQQEQIKKQEEDLKKQNDEKKQQEIKKQQIEAQKKQEELKKKDDELKKKQEDLKKQEEEKRREEEENEKKQKENEVNMAPKGKAMVTDDEKSGNTPEEIQKMKQSNSTPMVPVDDYQSGGSFSQLDVIKVMQKEKTAQAKKVNIVLPVAPNGGD